MPKRKSNIGASSRVARRRRTVRAAESQEEREDRLSQVRSRAETSRLRESSQEREARLSGDRSRHAAVRALETDLEREARLEGARSRQASLRALETQAEREVRLSGDRSRHAAVRAEETEVERDARLEGARSRQASLRALETQAEREVRLSGDRSRHAAVRAEETEEERTIRQQEDRERYHLTIDLHAMRRAEENVRLEGIRAAIPEAERIEALARGRERVSISREAESGPERGRRVAGERARHERRAMRQWREKLNSGFTYDPLLDYSQAANIGPMDNVCQHCQALTWKGEPKGICCSSGKVALPPTVEPPEPLKSLLSGEHERSRHFLQYVRIYNSAFQMTSFGGKEVTEGRYMPTFKVQGQVYHLIGSLLPPPQGTPSFLQVYFISDTRAQANARLAVFTDLDSVLVEELQGLLHQHNCYINFFQTALESIPPDSNDYKIVIRADRTPTGEHPGRYNAPTVNEVAVLLVGDPSDRRDIVLRRRSEGLSRICETHRSYDALQYPLMFCRGEDGYHFNYLHVDPNTGAATTKKTSACEFYSYRIMVRQGDRNHLHQFRQLFNQYIVDMYAKIESERLLYIRTNQKKLRAENYIHLQDALHREANVEELGRVIILPSSFTGGPRYMHSRTQDAFCYVRKYGRPDLFITVTTNPKWPEIKVELSGGQRPEHRHDIVSRVFYLKLKCLMSLLYKGKVFGTVRCYMYSVEWQKRGLPHAHILIWLEEPLRPELIDDVIRAELPDPQADPELYDIIKSHMLHGPCGALNRSSPCMKDGSCSKMYPKGFKEATVTGNDGYPQYRRRSPQTGGHTALISVCGESVRVDNRWVVPFSPVLSRTFKTHINVEYCSSVKSIKYICKYINKGSDQATFTINNEHDEVQRYQSGRYICTSEAVWRILSIPIHERYPPVIHLAVHLENGQRVYFTAENVRERVENPPKTTLLAFFNLCQTDTFARTLLYHEVPSYYTFDKQRGQFSRRKLGQPVDGHHGIRSNAALGRVFTVHPGNSECYHLRLLLHSVRGPTSFADLRTVRGMVHNTYQAACRELGLLEDDSHWEETLREACVSESPSKLRELFSVLVVFCNPANSLDLWTKFRDFLAEDHLRRAQVDGLSITYENTPSIYDKCLQDVQIVITRIGGLALTEYGLPTPALSIHRENTDFIRETTYNTAELTSFISECVPHLTDEQRDIYEKVVSSVVDPTVHNMYFLDAPGGTGKTFLIKLILAKIRSERRIALAVASSGIAATLLPGGRTAHSMFKIPLDIDRTEAPVCNISRNAPMAQVLKECALIVWDESTMSNKKAVESLDRTLKDIRMCDRPMGGVTVLFSGDFRQTLPVVSRGTRADEVNACLKRSYLWPYIQRLSLTTNMRVLLGGQDDAQAFSNILMSIGEGKLAEMNGKISISPNLATVVATQEALIHSVFPGVNQLPAIESSWLCERAILTPTNEQAAVINKRILSLFEGEERTYRSVNTVINQDDAVHYPVEFLDSVTAPGLPAHEITLKVGAPIILLRNLNPPKMVNGTRLRIRALHRYIIEADIMTGCGSGESVMIPRIPLIPSNYPFEFKRLQFPVSLCFAMTVNKSQGQTLKTAGVGLGETPCFSHGQLYVACSRVGASRNLFIHARDGLTTNVVYTEALE